MRSRTLVVLAVLLAAAFTASAVSKPVSVPVIAPMIQTTGTIQSPTVKAILNEGFESTTFPPTGWSLSGAAALWARSADCSGYGIGAASVRADFYNVNGGTQDLITYVCSPTGTSDSLVFDNAYAPYTPGTYRDSLTVWTSINGGSNWVKLIGLVGGPGGALATAPATGSSFVPTAGQWATRRYALPAGTNRITFRGHSAYGNELYLDNIHVIYPQQAHDLTIAAIISPASQQTAAASPQVLVENQGASPESSYVFMKIALGGNVVYSESTYVSLLDANDTMTATFPLWDAPSGNQYTVTTWTALAGDQVPGNDTMVTAINTYSVPRTVFGMDFTATWCTWCPWHQVAWKMLKDEVGDSLCVVAMHSSASNDSFYLASCGTLATFYGLTGYPTSVFDGINQFVGSDTAGAGVSQYNSFRAMFDSRKMINSPFSIALNGSYNNNSASLTATLEYPGVNPLAIDVRCAIIETSKYMVWPTGGSNLMQDTLRDFVRIILPSATGDTFTLATGTTVRNFPFTINGGWNKDKLEIVVWAALRGQREVVQSHEIPWSEMVNGVNGTPLTSPVASTLLQPCSPNPAHERTAIRYNLANTGQIKLGVYDITGRLVRTLVSGAQEAGSYAVSWNGVNDQGRAVAAGVYFVRLQAEGVTMAQRLTFIR